MSASKNNNQDHDDDESNLLLNGVSKDNSTIRISKRLYYFLICFNLSNILILLVGLFILFILPFLQPGSIETITQANSETYSQEGTLSTLLQGDEEEDDGFDHSRCEHEIFTESDVNNVVNLERQVLMANCGTYKFPTEASQKLKWNVVFYGPSWLNTDEGEESPIRYQSGCASHCPLSPSCSLTYTNLGHHLKEADVVVVFQSDYKYLTDISKEKIRVLYWREAHRTMVPLEIQQNNVDFEMGIHQQAQMINPQFLVTPHTLTKTVMKDSSILSKKKKFAIFIASDCHTSSFRQKYVDKLVQILGRDKIHQFGKCSNNILPGKSVDDARKEIESYKFYLSFENTIQQGYVTEKLFHILPMTIVPVYYGGLHPPNITQHKSYIRADEFSSPENLAKYLMYLNDHDEEYLKYHEWRKNPFAFDIQYLKKVQETSPGGLEKKIHASLHHSRSRASICCRLCNPDFVKKQVEERNRLGIKNSLVETPWNKEQIMKRFYSKE